MTATEKKKLQRKRRIELQRATRIAAGGCYAARHVPRQLDVVDARS